MIVTLEKAAQLLTTGHVVAVPTETVYGLAASIHHPLAIANIFTLKKRPSDNPLIVHLANAEELYRYAQEIPATTFALVKAFWPGPLTLVLKANLSINNIIRADLPTAAFRVPFHPLTHKLLQITGPLVMPSANLSGSPSATSPEHVAHDFGESLPILDGGTCKEGIESTILFYNGSAWEIARLGAIAPEAFKPVLGYIPAIHKITSQDDKPLCPGQMYRHYAPKAQLELCQEIPEGASIVIGFSDRTYPPGCKVIALGRSDRPEEVGRNLYTVLRDLDTANILAALVDFNIPDEGLWLTIKERLVKARA